MNQVGNFDQFDKRRFNHLQSIFYRNDRQKHFFSSLLAR